MPTRVPKKLIELRDRIYNTHMTIIKEEERRGKKIEKEIYILTAEDYEILKLNKEFRMLDEGGAPPFKKPSRNMDLTHTHVTKPNIGGYDVIRDETIDESAIEYNVIGNDLRIRVAIE